MVRESAYQKGKALAEQGSYAEAAAILIGLKDYKDTTSLMASNAGLSSAAAAAAEFERKWSVGNVVTYGRYEQDNNSANGKEPIRWRVLKREGDKALLVSEQNLDCQRYNTSYASVTWETCSLRAWLNGTFLNAAFTAEEQKGILTATLQNEDNPEYRTDGGNPTQDKMFLLSIAEAETLFRSDADRIAKNTAYAKAQGAYTNDSGAGWWWLRSPGGLQHLAAAVRGRLVDHSARCRRRRGRVRPFWLHLTSPYSLSACPQEHPPQAGTINHRRWNSVATAGDLTVITKAKEPCGYITR